MPETAMNKNCGIVFRENKVGLARQAGMMNAKPETLFMQAASDNELRAGVLAPDLRHHVAALFGGYNVSHGPQPPRILGGPATVGVFRLSSEPYVWQQH